jgi:hypothetical protein
MEHVVLLAEVLLPIELIPSEIAPLFPIVF